MAASPPPAVQAGASGTLKRFTTFASTRQQRQCRYCRDASVIIFDNRSGDELCARCGLVLEGRVMNEEQEWRSFSNADGGGGQEKSRVGGPNDAWMESEVQGTAMLGGDKKHTRLLQTHEMATALGGGDKLLRTAFGNLRNIADFFNLRDNVVERCKEMVKDLQNSDNLKSRTGDIYMLAAIYLACREEEAPKSLKELVTYNRVVSEKELGRAINRLKKLMPNRSMPVSATTANVVPRICQSLQLSQQLTVIAEQVSKKAEQHISKSHRPNSIAAGAVYLVTQIYGLNIDPSDIATTAKTGASTILAVYKELLPLSNQLVPASLET